MLKVYELFNADIELELADLLMTSTEDLVNSALSRGISYGLPFFGEAHSDQGFGYFVRYFKLI